MPAQDWPRYSEDDARWIEELRRRSHENRQRLGHMELELARLEKENERLGRRVDDLRRRLREKNLEMAQLISHTIIISVLVVAAVVLAVTGNDATYVWTLIAGYVGGGVVQKAVMTRDQHQ